MQLSMKNILSFLAFVGFASTSIAQTDLDALRYSTPLNLGTARSAGVGNALSGLGGDISTLNTNPAGIAQMSISEFSFSGGFNVHNSTSNYLGSSTEAQKTQFQVNNFGMVYVPKKQFTSVKNISIGASYNRLASFNYKIEANGTNQQSSYSDIYAETLNNAGADSSKALSNYPFGASLAFESGIIGMTADNRFYSILELPLTQRYVINRKGSQNEFSIGTGIAFNDQFLVGVSLGIPTINYEESFYVRETDDSNMTEEFIYWDKEDKYRSEGSGINAKFGVVYIPTPNLRLGASITTPTRYSMTDGYLTRFRADYETYTIDNFSNPAEGYFEYKYKTPMKINAGVSYIQPKLGFISVEYEYTDPSKSKFIFNDEDFDMDEFESDLNQSITDKYKASHTVKVGVEGKIAEKYRARAGFQYRTTPFQDQDNLNEFAKNNVIAISGGLGYRGKSFYTDLAYVHMISDELITPYKVALAPSPNMSNKYSRSNFLLTVGFKF